MVIVEIREGEGGNGVVEAVTEGKGRTCITVGREGKVERSRGLSESEADEREV